MAKIQEQIANARKANISDQEIFQAIAKSPKYAGGFEKARAAGLSNADIAKDLGLNLGDTQKVQIKDGKAKVGMQPIKTTAKAPSKTESFIIGAVNDIGGGINQGVSQLKDMASSGLNSVFGTNLDTARYDRVTRETKAVNDQHEKRRADAGKTGLDGWRLAGNVAASIPLAPATSGSLPVVAVKSALTGAGLGGASFAKDSNERLSNVVSGGFGGAVGGAVSKVASNAFVKGGNIIKGRMKEGVSEITDLGKQHGVRTSVGDAGANPHVRRIESQLDKVPIIGTSGFRAAQHKETEVAANNITEGLRKKMTDIDYKSLDKIYAAANKGDKNAMRIRSIVDGAGDDAGKILQAAAEIKNWRGQKVVSQIYDRVGQLAGKDKVPPTKTIQAIDDVIAQDSKVVPNDQLLSEISKIRSNLTNPNINTHYGELRSARSRLGELVDEWGQQGKSTNGLTKIRSAIDEDTADFAINSGKPSLITEYKRADSFYKELQKNKDSALAQSMRSKEPDQIYKTFVQFGKGDKAANFYKNLDPKGQSALRYEMANQALKKATNEGKGTFSPATFAQEFERLKDPYKNIFSKTDKAEMDGFIKLMRHVEQAGRYAENPANGSQLFLPSVMMGVGAGAVTAPLSTSVGITGTLLASKALTTEAGKRILLAANTLPPNSPKMASLLMQLQKLSTVAGASTATK